MHGRASSERYPWLRWIAGLVGLLALAALAVRQLDGFVADDAFILYRYAENLAAGDGWQYNPGSESANAATSVLYTLLLSAAALVTDRLPATGTFLTILGLAAAGAFSFATLRRVGDPIAGAVASVVLVTSPWLVSTRGMETPVFVALLAASLWAAVADRPVLLGLALGLATLARADALALAAPVLVWWWARDRRFPLVPAGIAAAVVAVWGAVAWITIGTPLTNTLAGKAAQAESGFWGEGPLFLKGFVDMPRLFDFGWWAVVVAVLAGGGIVAGLLHPARRALTVVLVSFAALHTLLYGLVLRPPAYHWYYGSELLVAALLAGLAIGALVERVPDDRARTATAAVATGAVALLALASTPGGYRYQTYEDASGWVRENTDPAASVAATEIGVIGYRTDRPIVDYLGLLDERSVDELRDGDLASWLARRRPDYWVVHNPAWPQELPALGTRELAERYEIVEQTDTFTVYRRRA